MTRMNWISVTILRLKLLYHFIIEFLHLLCVALRGFRATAPSLSRQLLCVMELWVMEEGHTVTPLHHSSAPLLTVMEWLSQTHLKLNVT